MSLVKEYFELTEKYQLEYGENTIVLMQVGSFFEVYGTYHKEKETILQSKIIEFSHICELNIAEKNTCVGEHNVMMAGFKDIQIEKYIRKLQDAGFTVVVYTQDENMKNTTRSLSGIFSPGTYFHNESKQLTNSITCIWIHYLENKLILKGKFVIVGIANIDIYTGKTTLFQYKEIYTHNPTTYDELERFISVYNPSEVIFISNIPHTKAIQDILSYAGIQCSLIHILDLNDPSSLTAAKATNINNCEKQIYQKEILSTFYKFDHFDIFIQNFNNNHIATQALCYLLNFIHQHNPQLVHKIAEPTFEHSSKRLTLANHSLKQLNIINDGNTHSGKYSCISHMLNHCITPMGKRNFTYILVHPMCNETELTREYNMTEHILSTYTTTYESFVKHKLTHIKDLSKLERLAVLKKISPKTIYSLYTSLTAILDVFEFIKEDKVWMDYMKEVDPDIVHIGTWCHELTSFIENHVDLSLCKEIDTLQYFETNFIKPGVDATLDNVFDTVTTSEASLEAIRTYLDKVIDGREKKHFRTNTEYVKIHETEKNNYSLLCTSRRCTLLKEGLPAVNHMEIPLPLKNHQTILFDISRSQFTFDKQNNTNNSILHPQIHTFCKNISSSKLTMKDRIALVYQQFIEDLCQFQTSLNKISQFITCVDILYTKATIATKYKYCKPTICSTSPKSFVKATSLRHCLIEQLNMNELYVSNDLSLGDGICDGILLYGTNAVGKTTIIRALGVAIILAQAGFYVPCTSFEYKPYSQIFTRIIGNDNIFKGQSTFEVEMSELRTILRMMDANSLILGDELCSGTETISAISIFVAGIQHMHEASSSFIFATHLHEIVEFPEIKQLTTVHLKHMEVAYNKEVGALVYDRKLKDGPGANMYGLEVCKSLDLPSTFLERANEIRMKYNTNGGQSILSFKQSRYNAKKLVSLCEQCGTAMGTEVHHLQHQSDANEDGMITTADSIFHKNKLANLMTLCEACHTLIHKQNMKQKKIKTTKGILTTTTSSTSS